MKKIMWITLLQYSFYSGTEPAISLQYAFQDLERNNQHIIFECPIIDHFIEILKVECFWKIICISDWRNPTMLDLEKMLEATSFTQTNDMIHLG